MLQIATVFLGESHAMLCKRQFLRRLVCSPELCCHVLIHSSQSWTSSTFFPGKACGDDMLPTELSKTSQPMTWNQPPKKEVLPAPIDLVLLPHLLAAVFVRTETLLEQYHQCLPSKPDADIPRAHSQGYLEIPTFSLTEMVGANAITVSGFPKRTIRISPRNES